MEITKRAPRAPVITLVSDAGMGKTSLACLFPGETFMIRTEDGLESVPEQYQPDVSDMVDRESVLWAQLKWLATQDHPYHNVVLDSITRLDALFIQAVIQADAAAGGKIRSIQTAAGGYGAGMGQVASKHMSVRSMLGKINDRGITVIILAHAASEEFSPPDGDKYTRWNLKLDKKCISPYVDDVDLVGFIKLDSFVKLLEGKMNEGKAGKIKDTGDRVIVCHATANNISKNRYGIKDPIDFKEGVNPLLPYIPYYSYLFQDDQAADQQSDNSQEQQQ